MTNETFNFEDTPTTGRTLPIEGKPFALMMAELWDEGGNTGRLVR
jgi:hypothetical protein